MRVSFCENNFDRLDVPLASLPFFSDQRPLGKTLALVDWRLNGRLSQLIDSGRVHGSFGETVFVPTQGRLESPTLILYGLGESRRWDINRAESAFFPWIEKLASLKQDPWLLSFAALSDDFLSWRHCVRVFIHSLVHRSKPVCSHLYLVESPECIQETRKRRMDFGETVQVEYN